MYRKRCGICHISLPTPKKRMRHYLKSHSKFELAREICKLSIKNTTPKLFVKRQQLKTEIESKTNTTVIKKKTIFSNDTVQITCTNNEIIIRTDKSSLDMELSFNENPDEKEGKCFASTKLTNNNKGLLDIVGGINNNESSKLSKIANIRLLGPAISSREDSLKKIAFKKVIRKKRYIRDETKQCKINITQMNCLSLNEATGYFYQCHCRNDNRKGTNDNKDVKLTFISESVSKTEKADNIDHPTVFCCKCGNGYRDERLLLDHMKTHETHCRVCNEIFPTEQAFKQHVESHIFKVFVCPICNYEFTSQLMIKKHLENHKEDSIFESVIDMEEEFGVTQCGLPNPSYQSNIDNILSYLNDSNNNSEFYCNVCRVRVLFEDYLIHIQRHC